MLLYEFRSSSKIDITPLYALSGVEYIDDESLGAILDIINMREDFSSVRFSAGDSVEIYDFGWHGNTSPREPGGVRVKIWYLSSSEEAVIDFNSNWGKCKHISVSEYIKANLYHSEMYRSAHTFLAADWRKHGTTHILIGNLMIIIHETESFFNIGIWTSGSIEVLSEIFSSVMLESEVGPGD
jgi:hypothetical protein